MNWGKIDNLKREYLTDVIQPSFPFIKNIGSSPWSKQGSNKPQLSFGIAKQNSSLKGSEYYYSKHNRFIHYTSLENAVNIFNDGFFKLNSLAYMDDPQEMLFALKDAQELEHLKQYTFCFSFCEYDETENPDSFDSWRLYGRDGYGIGIVFKFIPTLDLWSNSYLSVIHYGTQMTNVDGVEETTKKFELFKENQSKFISKHLDHVEFLPHQFNKHRQLPDWLAILLAFHKSSLYKIEKEIRYLKNVDNLPKSFILNQKLERTCYEKLMITNRDLKEKENSSKEILEPVVEIEKIIVGYRRADELKRTLRDGLDHIDYFFTQVVDTPISDAFKTQPCR